MRVNTRFKIFIVSKNYDVKDIDFFNWVSKKAKWLRLIKTTRWRKNFTERESNTIIIHTEKTIL